MTISNSLPDLDLDKTAGDLRTLGDPVRLRILQALTVDCRSVTEIVAEVSLPQPLISHHLRILRDRGFTRAERRGAFTFY